MGGGNYILGQVDDALYAFIGETATHTGIREKDRIVDARYFGNSILYVTELGGIKRYHNGIIRDEFPELNKQLKLKRIFSAKIQENGDFILGTVLDGAFIINKKGEILEHFNEKNGMDYSTVLSVQDDKRGNYWFGLDGGLAKYNATSSELFYTSKNQNIGDVYSAIVYNDTLYLGTNKGLFWVDSQRNSHLVKGLYGVVWNIIDCDDFLAIEMDNNLYTVYPDGHYNKILSNIWKLSKWKDIDNLYYCSDLDGIVFLERKNKVLTIRNRLENDCRYSRVPLKHDNMGDLWIDGLWGGVQRIVLDKEKRKIVKEQFYSIGDPTSITLSHYVDNQIIFTQGNRCFTYNRDTDEISYSRYYSDICDSFENNTSSLLQKGNLYFHFGGNEIGLVERHGDTMSYISGTFFKFDNYEFSENYSKLSELNDSLIVIGCNNGIVLYNVNTHTSPRPVTVNIVNCTYKTNKGTHLAYRPDNRPIEIPYNATEISIKLSGVSKQSTVYYKIDSNQRSLIKNTSTLTVPCPSSGHHYITFYDGSGKEILKTHLKIKRHWLLSWWFILLIIAFLITVFIVFASLLFHRTQILKHKYAIKQQELREKEKIKFENEKLSMELRERNARLTCLALNDITVNNMLKEIDSKLDSAASVSKEMKSALRPVKKTIEKHFRDNGSWKAFEVYFNGIYDGFFDRLKEKYPQLTQNEIKICSYIRLGMSNKEIASLMNIEISSVESARYRLRKNIGLNHNDSLSDIISKI